MLDHMSKINQLEFLPEHVAPVNRSNGFYLLICADKLAVGSSELFDCFWGSALYDQMCSQISEQDKKSEHFLGYLNKQPCWVVELTNADLQQAIDCQWVPLRSCLGVYPDVIFNCLGRGFQLLNWYQSHQYCGSCGQPTLVVEDECATKCVGCNHMFFPRLSPCAIVLVTNGDYCLLARNIAWERDHFSPVAGFIEAGEGAEDTARREAFEEVGVKVGELRYIGSQPWPFPGQLMLGFIGDYESGDIVPDGVEIVEAKWFKYDDLPRKFYPATLSGRLVDQFARERTAFNADRK
jgi:NAD+ diphosphatase